MISFFSGVAASVATSPRDLANTTGLQSVQYSRCRQSIPAGNTLKNIKNIWQNIENIQQEVRWLGTEHGGEVVSLPLGLVLAEVAVLPQPAPLHHTRLHQPRQARDVAETEVHPLNNQSEVSIVAG